MLQIPCAPVFQCILHIRGIQLGLELPDSCIRSHFIYQNLKVWFWETLWEATKHVTHVHNR